MNRRGAIGLVAVALLCIVLLGAAGQVTRQESDALPQQVEGPRQEFEELQKKVAEVEKATRYNKADIALLKGRLERLEKGTQQAEDSASAQERTKQEAWQSDYDQFIKTFQKAVSVSDPMAPFNEFNDQFAGKEVRWVMKFEGTQRDDNGLTVQFKGVPPGLTFVSSPDAAPQWGNLKPGSPVTVTGKIKITGCFTLNPDMHGRGIRGGFVAFEDVRPTEPTNK